MTIFRFDGEMGENGHRLHSHCRRGHEFTPENSYYKPDGKRNCKTCRAMRNAGYVRVRNGVPDILRIDGEPVIDTLAAITRQAIRDYRAGEGEDYESALDYLAAAGLLDRNGNVRHLIPRSSQC